MGAYGAASGIRTCNAFPHTRLPSGPSTSYRIAANIPRRTIFTLFHRLRAAQKASACGHRAEGTRYGRSMATGVGVEPTKPIAGLIGFRDRTVQPLTVPAKYGAPCGTRTHDLPIKGRLLYQLS